MMEYKEWSDEEEERAYLHSQRVKLLLLINAGVVAAEELAGVHLANFRPGGIRAAAANIRRSAILESSRRPQLAALARRWAKHDPLGARRWARAQIREMFEENVLFTAAFLSMRTGYQFDADRVDELYA